MINTITHTQTQTLSAYQSSTLDPATVAKGNENGTQTQGSDSISLRSDSTQTVTYSGNMQMNASDKSRYGMLQSLVANLLKEQGINTKLATRGSEIDIAAIAPEEAQQLISENGYFGVQQTSDRIVQFAIETAGGDPSRIDAIKEGVEKGFSEAKKAFGDWLPDISYTTYNAVMEKLDKWVAESKAVA